MHTHAVQTEAAKPARNIASIHQAVAPPRLQRKGMCSCGGSCPECAEPTIQTKLAINTPGDSFEMEADRVADQVMRMEAPVLQRKCPCGGSCPECSGASDDLLHRKADGPAARVAPPSVHQVLSGPGRPLDSGAKAFMEPRFGASFDHVRIHNDARAAESARDVNALAYTVGSSIVFAGGQYAPETEAGRRLLAHELAHTIQQSGANLALQRVVDFATSFSNLSLTGGTGATMAGDTIRYQDASFSVDANITATGDTEAELKDWDVGIFQDQVRGWERKYWLRDNTDGRGQFVEKKLIAGDQRLRDQARGATTIWDADDEHTDLSTVAAAAAGARFQASTTITTSDGPGGPEPTDGARVHDMDATDGDHNFRTLRGGARFQTWISAHNTVTDEIRHLRWINWNYSHSLDFTGTGASLAIGPESWETGHFSQVPAAGDAPLLTGTTANTVYNDNASWTFKRVKGWT